jgi:hypothetical protein
MVFTNVWMFSHSSVIRCITSRALIKTTKVMKIDSEANKVNNRFIHSCSVTGHELVELPVMKRTAFDLIVLPNSFASSGFLF